MKRSDYILKGIVDHLSDLKVFITQDDAKDPFNLNGHIDFACDKDVSLADQQKWSHETNLQYVSEAVKSYTKALESEAVEQFRLDKFNEQYALCLKNINPFDTLSGKVVVLSNGDICWFKEAGYNISADGKPIWTNLHREDLFKPVIISFIKGGCAPVIAYKYEDDLILYDIVAGLFTSNPTKTPHKELCKMYKCIAE